MFSGLRCRWPEMDHQDLALERLPLHLPCNAPPAPRHGACSAPRFLDRTKATSLALARWLSWLKRRPVHRKVLGLISGGGV